MTLESTIGIASFVLTAIGVVLTVVIRNKKQTNTCEAMEEKIKETIRYNPETGEVVKKTERSVKTYSKSCEENQ